MDIRQGFKILTHDYKPPIQGGEPLLTASQRLPLALPTVPLDTSNSECGAGYNYCRDLVTAARIAGYWKTGRPAKCFVVEAGTDAIERGNKRRSSTLTLLREATHEELLGSMGQNVSWVGPHTEYLAQHQMDWYTALGRPNYNKDLVIRGLQTALATRGLNWQLKEYRDARDARAAWDARDTRAAWGARDTWAVWDARAAWDTRDTRDAWDAWYARAARAARAARDTWDAWDTRAAWDARGAWDAWGARAAWDAYYACTLCASVLRFGLTGYDHNHLSTGLLESYTNGLDVAFPTKKDELGFVMSSK
jgi:hypothetical protein